MKAGPFLFSAPDWFGFFEQRGFRVLEKIGVGDEARRLRRRPPFPFSMIVTLPKKWREEAQNNTVTCCYERIVSKYRWGIA